MQIRTDLAMESRELAGGLSGIITHTLQRGAIEETRVRVETEEAARALEKAQGTYITLAHSGLAVCPAEERISRTTISGLTTPRNSWICGSKRTSTLEKEACARCPLL